MKHNTPKLTDTQTLDTARSILETHLPLEAQGYCCQSEHLYEALLAVCASGETLESGMPGSAWHPRSGHRARLPQ